MPFGQLGDAPDAFKRTTLGTGPEHMAGLQCKASVRPFFESLIEFRLCFYFYQFLCVYLCFGLVLRPERIQHVEIYAISQARFRFRQYFNMKIYKHIVFPPV